MKFRITENLSENNFTVTVEASSINQYTEYAYYLYNANRECLSKIWYTKQISCSFLLDTPGGYYVKVFVRGKDDHSEDYWKVAQNSKIVTLYDEEVYDFFRDDRPLPQLQLPFCKASVPRQDILLARIPLSAISYFQGIAKDTSLNYCLLDSSTQAMVVLTGMPLFEAPNHRAALSGIGRTNNRLIIGMQDLDSVETVEELSEQVGCFWLFHQAGKTITLETDYFGNEKLYYYSENGVFLVSNRIHLLILAMKALNIERLPNLPKIHAYLSVSNQLFMQNFAQEMNICNIFVLPADSRIRADLQKNRIEIEKTDLYYALAASLRYDEASYRKLLHQAADELIDNARIAFEYPGFEQCVVHITGGLDSRLVYAVLSRLPQYRDQIIAQTNTNASHIRDYDVAAKVISKYPVSKKQITLTAAEAPEGNIHIQALSLVLGTTSEYTARDAYVYQDTFTLPGYFGEITGRPYYSCDKFETPMGDSTLSNSAFYNHAIQNHVSRAIFDVDNCLLNTFSQACLALPGRTNLEKYENHYLYYRNGLHFNVCHISETAPAWGILQSKSLLKLKYMTFPLNWGIRLQLDMLYLLNPEIASVEFESEKNQAERAALHKQYGKYPESYQHDEALINEIKLQLKNVIKRPHGKSDNTQAVDKTDIYTEKDALNILHYLYRNSYLHPDAANALYHYIRYESNASKKKLLIKLYSLYFELSL